MSAGPVAPRGYVSPAVRRLSARHGVDPTTLAGSGAGGRVTVRDVERAVAATARPAGDPAGATGDGAGGAAVVVPFDRRRLATARHLRRSLDTAAHALVVTEVDYAGVERARARAAASGRTLGYLAFVARAALDALVSYPEVNAVVRQDTLVLGRARNLGIAVDLDHRGLVVPVVAGADRLSLRGLAQEIDRVGQGARQGTLAPSEYEGGTFTLTNVGRYGTLISGPIIHHPQVAILSTDGVKPRPVAVPDAHGGHAVAVHPLGNLSLSFDHRAFDGAYASAFLAAVRDALVGRDWEAEL